MTPEQQTPASVGEVVTQDMIDAAYEAWGAFKPTKDDASGYGAMRAALEAALTTANPGGIDWFGEWAATSSLRIKDAALINRLSAEREGRERLLLKARSAIEAGLATLKGLDVTVGGRVSLMQMTSAEITAALSTQGESRQEGAAVDRVMAVLNYWFDGVRRIDRNSEMVAQLAALVAPIPADNSDEGEGT